MMSRAIPLFIAISLSLSVRTALADPVMDLRNLMARSSFQLPYPLSADPKSSVQDLAMHSKNATACRFHAENNDGSAIEEPVRVIAQEPLYLIHVRSLDPISKTEHSGVRTGEDVVLTFRTPGNFHQFFKLTCGFKTPSAVAHMMTIDELRAALGGELTIRQPGETGYVSLEDAIGRLVQSEVSNQLRGLIDGAIDELLCKNDHSPNDVSLAIFLTDLRNRSAYEMIHNAITFSSVIPEISRLETGMVTLYQKLVSYQGADR